jgi:hypothetical protein
VWPLCYFWLFSTALHAAASRFATLLSGCRLVGQGTCGFADRLPLSSLAPTRQAILQGRKLSPEYQSRGSQPSFGCLCRCAERALEVLPGEEVAGCQLAVHEADLDPIVLLGG